MQTKSAATLRLPDLSASSLHILAMGLMLLDHLWATIVPGQDWMTCAGRLAYPIFAFLLAEGYAHTSSFRRYASRLLFWAVVSEIPFNLMYSSQAIYPYHQNVLWTLLIALCAMRLADLVREKLPVWLGMPAALGLGGVAALLATLAMTDYFAAGVLTVFAFYLFRGEGLWRKAGLLVCLWWIHVKLLGGLFYPIELFGFQFELVQQGFALLALIPIWLYRGRQGLHSRGFKLFCYAFYPGHMLVLALLQSILL